MCMINYQAKYIANLISYLVNLIDKYIILMSNEEYVVHINYSAAIEELGMIRISICSNRRYQPEKERLKNLIDAIKEVLNKRTNNFGERMRNECIAIWLKKQVDES